MKHYLLPILCLFLSNIIWAQDSEAFEEPLNGIVKKTTHLERRVLPDPPIREADIFWEKRVSRVIDTREKMNQVFRKPSRYFFSILEEGLQEGKLRAYGVNDQEDFSEPLTQEEVDGMILQIDTIPIWNPDDWTQDIEIVYNKLNPEDIKRYRVKEIWYFDSRTSTLRVKILGIAPLREIYDDAGNFLYELPMFWIYMPHAKETLARETVFNSGNDNAPMTWNDLFQMRQFSSYIYKQSDVLDRRIQDYASGLDILLESKKINEEIFNFEHDLWEF